MVAAKLDTLQNVELAEGVRVLLRPAGPIPRALALMLDLLVCALFVVGGVLLGTFLINVLGADFAGVAGGFLLLFAFTVYWGYFMLFEVLRGGQTPGKRICGLRVVMVSGVRMTWGASFLRNLVRFADMMPMFPGLPVLGFHLFGLTCCLATSRFQRLGDLVADTVVIYDRDRVPEAPVKLRNPILPKAPPVVLTREEQLAFMHFLERSALWSDARKEELVAPLQEVLGASGREGVAQALSIGVWVRDS